jgi:DNA replication protein DnaC
MANLHHLTSKLKALKMGGMMDTLELRLNDAQQEDVGYREFLEILLEDEIQRRGNNKLSRLVAQAHFEEVKTFESFDYSFNTKMPTKQLKELAACHFLERGEWVLLLGQVGVGKSHILQALGHQACRLGYRVLYMKTMRMFGDLGGGHADGTWERRFRRYLKPDLLLLDDFAIKEFSPQQAEDIYELVDERGRSGSLVVASNRSPQDWYPLFPNPVLAEGALDRLINKAHHVIITGKSYRPRLRPDRAEASSKAVKGNGRKVK